MKNYNDLTIEEKHLLISNLRAMREALKKENKAKKVRGKRQSKKRKTVKFDNPELEKIFHEMPKEAQDYILGKG